MKLKLVTDFIQWYDKYFDDDGLEFRRVMTDGPNRLEMNKLFAKCGILTPLFGNYNVFIKNNYEKDKKVVIYDDIHSHCGENKRLLIFSELKADDKLKYLCEFISHDITAFSDYLARSTRQLFIGNLVYQYNYFSYNDWRSNCGRIHISEPMQIELPSWRKLICYPFFAIDYVGSDNNKLAIDLNISPGVNGINLGKLISGQLIVTEIKRWLIDYVQEKN